jgi:hypothetical protein
MPTVRARASLVALMLALTLLVGTAHADDAQQARDLFTQGNTFFDLGQFDKAIDAWQRGYQLKNDAGFLYNIAQAYRVMENAEKAIFFYKRYLANYPPKAHNRTEVEQKIEALQKQLQQQDQAKQIPPPGPLGPGNPVPGANPTPADATSPPPSSPTGPASAPGAAATATGEVAAASTGPSGETYAAPRRVDLAAAVGFDTWASGVQGTADPSFALTLAGGYIFGAPTSTVRFRLGALFGYTFLQETNSKDSFASFLIDPTVEFRLAQRVRLDVDLGIGVLSIGGLNANSALLANSMVTVKGTQALSEVRIGAGVQYQLTPMLSVFAWPAIANSPQKEHFHAAISRIELLAGLVIRP